MIPIRLPASRIMPPSKINSGDPGADKSLSLFAMIFNETAISGVFEIRIQAIRDERGFFARTWCRKEFEEHGLESTLVQCNISFNARKGTLRGMHYQAT